MEILIVTATALEVRKVYTQLQQHWIPSDAQCFTKGQLTVRLCVTGVGAVATTHALTKAILQNRPDLVLNCGIAGALDPTLMIGDVLNVRSDRFADLGAEDAEGNFLDLHTLNLESPLSEILKNPGIDRFHFLPLADGVTVNTVHGEAGRISAFKKRVVADLETQESAAVFFVCLQENIPFLALRAVSNFVEPRDRSKWDIPLAVEHLNKHVLDILKLLA